MPGAPAGQTKPDLPISKSGCRLAPSPIGKDHAGCAHKRPMAPPTSVAGGAGAAAAAPAATATTTDGASGCGAGKKAVIVGAGETRGGARCMFVFCDLYRRCHSARRRACQRTVPPPAACGCRPLWRPGGHAAGQAGDFRCRCRASFAASFWVHRRSTLRLIASRCSVCVCCAVDVSSCTRARAPTERCCALALTPTTPSASPGLAGGRV